MRTVSASEANQQFSRLLREVAAGERVAITQRGRRVAKLVPLDDDDAGAQARRVEAGRRYLELVRQRPPSPPVNWTRDDLYE